MWVSYVGKQVVIDLVIGYCVQGYQDKFVGDDLELFWVNCGEDDQQDEGDQCLVGYMWCVVVLGLW